MTTETIRVLFEAALEAAEITKNELKEDLAYPAIADYAYEAMVDKMDNRDLKPKGQPGHKGLRSDELPHPALGAPEVFRAAYEAALQAS